MQADVGIIGANFAIANSGAVVIVTNEGNGPLVSALPRLTIAIFGSENIIENTADAGTDHERLREDSRATLASPKAGAS